MKGSWKIAIIGSGIIAFVATILPLYFFSKTIPDTEKNSLMLSALMYFGLFMVLVFLIVEIIDFNQRLEILESTLPPSGTSSTNPSPIIDEVK